MPPRFVRKVQNWRPASHTNLQTRQLYLHSAYLCVVDKYSPLRRPSNNEQSLDGDWTRHVPWMDHDAQSESIGIVAEWWSTRRAKSGSP